MAPERLVILILLDRVELDTDTAYSLASPPGIRFEACIVGLTVYLPLASSLRRPIPSLRRLHLRVHAYSPSIFASQLQGLQVQMGC